MRYVKPADGHEHNPLCEPSLRNTKCICQSGRKVKSCCGRFRYVTFDEAENIRALMNAMANALAASLISRKQ